MSYEVTKLYQEMLEKLRAERYTKRYKENDHEYTNRKMAKKVGVSATQYCKYEDNIHTPPTTVFIKWCESLGYAFELNGLSTWDEIHKNLNKNFKIYIDWGGSFTEIKSKSGFCKETVESWLKGTTIPNIYNLLELNRVMYMSDEVVFCKKG